MTRFVLMVLVLKIFSYSLYAQEVIELTLERSLKIALENNPNYIASLKRVDEAKGKRWEAISELLPALDLRETTTLREKVIEVEIPAFFPGQRPTKARFDFTKDYEFNLFFTQPIYTGGKLAANLKQSIYNFKLNEEIENQTKQTLIFEIKRTFYGYLVAQELLKFSQEALELGEKHLERTKVLYEQGIASKLDLMRAEVQVANLKPQKIKAENNLKLVEISLKNLLGLDPKIPIKIKGSLEHRDIQLDSQNILKKAIEKRPELNQLRYQRGIGEQILKIAKASYIPNFSIVGSFNYRMDRLTLNRKVWDEYYSVNLVLTYPIFAGVSREAKIMQSKAILERIDYTYKAVEDAVRIEIEEALLNLKEAKEIIESQERNIEQAKESVRIAELNYEEGLVTSLEVLTAHQALTQAEMNLSQALYSWLVASAKLERATGIPLEELEKIG
ncbi:MAG: TolC family protein [Acidobacteriota bacterium]